MLRTAPYPPPRPLPVHLQHCPHPLLPHPLPLHTCSSGPVSVGKSLIHMEAVFLRLLANIEITWGWGELIKKSRFLGLILGGSESVALGRAQKLPFDKFSDGGDPRLHLHSPLALQNEQGHPGKCVKQIWK